MKGLVEYENWKSAYDAVQEHVSALRKHVIALRDEGIRLAMERDEWKRAYEASRRPFPFL